MSTSDLDSVNWPRCALRLGQRWFQVRAEKPAWHLAVIAGAVLRTLGHVAVRSAEYLGYLQKGQLPPARISLTAFTEEVVLDSAAHLVFSRAKQPRGNPRGG